MLHRGRTDGNQGRLYINRYTIPGVAEPAVVVDRESGEPVYAQIARQIREAVSAGRLRPGDALPTVRALASDLGVNLNTVARGYRQLEEEGFVVLRDRSGAEIAPPSRRPQRETREELLAELRSLLSRMRQAGLDPDSLERLVGREIAALAAAERKTR